MSLGINSALYLANSGLQASRQQTEVAGRNLANSSTPGATRQSVVVQPGATVDIGGSPTASGVTVDGVVSARSAYLDAAVQNENANLGYASTLDSVLQSVENTLQESLGTSGTADSSSSTGLEAAATAFYNAWSDLAANPGSSVFQNQVSSAAQSFISTAQSVYNGVLGVKSGGFSNADAQVSQVNALSAEIAAVNKSILAAETAGASADGTVNQANDLRDERQGLIEQLSSLVNITVEQDPENPSLVDIKMADPSTATDTASTAGTFSGNSIGSDLSGLTSGSISINGIKVPYNGTDTISQLADKINASATGVTATVVNGKLSLNSSVPITVADADGGNFVAKSGLANSGATVSSPIYLVSGTASGGTSGDGHQTYSLTVAGSDAAASDSGYQAGAKMTILATTSSGAVAIANPTGGSLGGLVYMDNSVIGSESTDPSVFQQGGTLLDKLNTFAYHAANDVNTVTSSGFGTDGDLNSTPNVPPSAGENFFVTDTGTNALSTTDFDINGLKLNNLYNSQSTTTYNGSAIPTGSSAATFMDGQNAQAIANSLSDDDILPYYQGVVSSIGSQRGAAATNLSSQQLLTSQATSQQQSYEGISTDDEMTNLMSFQRAFEASSRFINILDQMYQTVNGLGSGS